LTGWALFIRILKYVAWIGAPIAWVSVLVSIVLIQGAPYLPQPERGFTVAILATGGGHRYVAWWMLALMKVSIGLAVTTMICGFASAMFGDREG
jgi:hypothetical protein